MSEHTAQLAWRREADAVFTDQRYTRRHVLQFDGGAQVVGSSAPSSVPLPWSDPQAVDPEEMLVASLSSCHMLGSCRWRRRRGTWSTATPTAPVAHWPKTNAAASA